MTTIAPEVTIGTLTTWYDTNIRSHKNQGFKFHNYKYDNFQKSDKRRNL